MGGKSTDTGGNTGYTGGLTPYAQNLFGGTPAPPTDSGPTKMQNLGQQIMKASNAYSASQGGPEEQAIAGIGNALVNKFAPKPPITSPTNPTPNLFGGTPPTFTPQTPITSPMLSGNPFAPGTPMPMFKPTSSTPVQLNPGISMPMFNPGSTGLQMNQPITSPMLQSFSPANQAPNLFGR